MSDGILISTLKENKLMGSREEVLAFDNALTKLALQRDICKNLQDASKRLDFSLPDTAFLTIM